MPARSTAVALVVAGTLSVTLALTGTLTLGVQQLPDIPLSALRTSSGRVAVLIEMQEASAGEAFAGVIGNATALTPALRSAAASAGQTQAQRVTAEQQQVVSTIASRGIGLTEIYRVQKAMNAIAAEVDGASVARLRQTPGVKAVHVLELEYPTNSGAVPFTGAPPVWGNTLGLPAGATGTGVKVGIIDTGVDYLHATFGGSGLLADYGANNRTVAPDAYFPSAKVVGGWDFAGDTYTGSAGTIAADPDPMDCNGHGSHVAGTAAGFGVNADGTTYASAYGPSTPFSSLRIGPGSAPQAQLYALRVFGCGGGTNLTVQAIEWAMDPNGDTDMSDHLDVINMSLGSSLGSLTSTSTIAAENAAAVGIVVVASAGNNGDTYFVNGAPGVSNRTISVAASIDGGVGALTLRVNLPPGIAGFKTTGVAFFGGVPPAGGSTADLVQAVDTADGAGPATTDACSVVTNAGAVAGHIAFVDRGTCGFNVKAKNVQDAGAIGIVIANNVAGAVGNLSGTDPTVTIPVFMVSQTDGNSIRANLGSTVNVTLFNGGDTLASFSSRGPGPGFRLKPDIAAPGYLIQSAQTGTTCTGTSPSTGCQTANATGYLPDSQPLILNGTSMAAPHVAGVMALLRQLHPDWSVEQLKALAMNTAVHDLTTLPDAAGSRYGTSRIGAGRVDASKAAQSSVVAFNASDAGAVSVSFDTHIVNGTATETKRIRLVNASGTAQTYDLGLDTVVDAPGFAFALPGSSSVTVPAHSSIEVDVRLDANAALMAHAREASVAGTQTATSTLAGAGVQNRHWITEENGYVTLSQSGSVKLRVPLYATGRPGSAMSSSGQIVTGGAPTGSTTIALAGTGVCTGTLNAGPACAGTFNAAPFDVTSLVSPFQLQAISPRSPSIPASADIQYGGVAFDSANNKLMFGVSMWGAWGSPSDTTVNIYVDNNNDGTWDTILFDGNTGTHGSYLFGNTTDPQDTFINLRLTIATSGVAIPSVATGRYVNGDPGVKDSALFNSSVRILSAAPSTLGISGGIFHYKIVTCPGTLLLCQRFDSFYYDEATLGGTPSGFVFDTANQGLNFGGATLAQDLNGGSLPVTWNTTNLATQGSRGALLLHHHNTHGTQAEFVPMDGTATTDLAISVTSAPSAPTKGSTVTLTASVTNLGPMHTCSPMATIELPAGLTYVSDDSGGAFNPATGEWTLSDLSAGSTTTVHITATVASTDPQIVSAFVTAPDPLDTVLANNQSSVNVMAPRDADLEVTSVPNVSSAIAGTPVTYTVTVTNKGDDPAFDIVVGESVTSGAATFGAGTPSAGTYNSSTGAWRLATLGKGVTQTLSFTVTAQSGPTLTTRASVSSGVGDLTTGNNSADASTSISTRATTTVPSLAASVTAGQLTPVTVLVTDTQSGGTTSNPTGSVVLGSSVIADAFVGTCTLAAVPLTTHQSSCQVNARFDSGGARTITATYSGSATHATSASTAPSSAACNYVVTPGTLTFAAAGGSSSANVATASGCNWSASSDASFTTVTGGATGTGNGTVNYSVAANSQPVSRTATLTIAGQSLTVAQGPAACTYAIAPTSASFSSAGGTGSVTVTTQVPCTVSAVSNNSFIQITSIGSGASAIVQYSVAANPPPGAARSGTMTIAGHTFTVNQGAIGTLTLDRSSLSFGATNMGTALADQTAAQAVSVDITSADTIQWTATVDQPWIQVTPASGTGDGTFNVAVVHSSFLPPTGNPSGTVTVTAPGVSNSPQTIAVHLALRPRVQTQPPVGFMDTPANGTTGVHGGLAVTGWALDDVEVTRVRIYRDPVSPEPSTGPVFIGDALFVADARPDVELGMPGMPFGYRAGWGMVVLTNTLPRGGNGPFTLHAYAEDREGHVAWIGSRSFTADNATSTAPFGTIDTPVPGQTVSGVFANFGWALTPLTKTIPVDGSSIQVYIDGVLRGNPTYNLARPDVIAVFPGLNNSAGPVGAFVFDSSTLTNGVHSILWVVRDNAGAEAGIGSRFFRVQNPGSGSSVTEVTALSVRADEQIAAAAAPALRADEIGVRRTIERDAPMQAVQAVGDAHRVTVKPLEPIEVHIAGESDEVTGYMIVGDERRRLPPGSTLDGKRGVFYWQPAAAFLGQYELVFERGGVETRVVINVK